MAKSTNGGKSKTGSAETKATTTEPKARRVPARRRADKKTIDTPVAVASELATTEATAQTAALETSPNGIASAFGAGLNAEEIRRRAYEIFCGRGCRDGGDVDDWLEAERQLRQSRTH